MVAVAFVGDVIMSATHRCLARLPIDIFADLITRPEECQQDAASLRGLICSKLQQAHIIQGKMTESVTTVGKLLRLSSPALLRALDPLLTHGMFDALEYTVLVSRCLSLSLISEVSLAHHSGMSRARATYFCSLCPITHECSSPSSRIVRFSATAPTNWHAVSG
jgi:hypothetical protein